MRVQAGHGGPGSEQRRIAVVIDPDPLLREPLVEALRAGGIDALGAADARTARGFLDVRACDLVLTEIDLPDASGLTLVRDLRAVSAMGIVVLSTRREEVDRIVALEMGADDYLAKPYSIREVGVRCRNLLWRVASAGAAAAARNRQHIRFSDWTFDTGKRLLIGSDDQPILLTRQEAAVLQALASNPGRVMTRDALMDAVGRGWNPNDRTVDVLIGRLRKKIEHDPAHPETIVTVYGEGYMFGEVTY